VPYLIDEAAYNHLNLVVSLYRTRVAPSFTDGLMVDTKHFCDKLMNRLFAIRKLY